MKSSSFLCGALFGMAAVVWASKRKGWVSMLTEAGSYIKMPSAGNKCNSRHQGHDGTKAESKADFAASGAAATAQVPPSSSSQNHEDHSKEYHLKQLKELIKGSTDVRREVEAILKESHTAVPGL